jgi:minimal PKS ketosynthase (KS/KS alpha)
VTRRVAVTGIGVVAPGGTGATAFWDLLSGGRTATRGITLFDPAGLRSRIAAECDFDPFAHGLDPALSQHADRYIQFAMVAAAEAVGDSGLDTGTQDPWRVAVSLGSAVGGTTRLEHDYVQVSEGGQRWDVDPRGADPQLHRACSPSTLASVVAEQFGAQGPVQTVSTGCTSGIDAVGYAFHTIEEGRADICIAGAADSPISPITMACFDAIKATSDNNDDPEHASRPFDARRNGFVMGEGAAVLVLEEYEHARARGAHVYCEIGGYATFDLGLGYDFGAVGPWKGAKATLNITNLSDERHASNFDSSVFAPDDAAGSILVFHSSAPRQIFATIGVNF